MPSMTIRLTLCLAVLAGLLPLPATAAVPFGPPALLEADHVMGKWVRPRPKPAPVLDPKRAARAEALLEQAHDKLARGEYKEADALLLEAKQANPDHVGILKARTRALLTLGYLDWNEEQALAARAEITRARRLSPDDGALLELERLVLSLVDRIQRLKTPKPKPKKTQAAVRPIRAAAK